MKQYTTSNVTVRLKGADQLIAGASLISACFKGNVKIDFDKSQLKLSGDTITIPLTQGQTGKLGPGRVELEITLGFPDGTTLKSETFEIRIKEAVRKETL